MKNKTTVNAFDLILKRYTAYTAHYDGEPLYEGRAFLARSEQEAYEEACKSLDGVFTYDPKLVYIEAMEERDER